MCPPVIAAAAAVVSAAGSIYSGMAANAAGKYQQRVAEQNAKIAAEAAKDSIERGKLENQALGRKVAQTKGQQAAAAAANGVDLGYGTADVFRQDTEMLAREDQAALFKNIDERTRGFDIQGANYRAEGKANWFQGKQAKISSFFQAGSTLLSGAQQVIKLGRTSGR